MKSNYNPWFYSQHKYRTSKRDNVESFTDTKWVDDHNRFRKLIEMESELIAEQPSMIHGNHYGFDMLIDLMGRSNYTFEDLDEAMIATYKTSLQNAMSYNLVNTHAIIFNTNNKDSDNVFAEKFSHYKIIDVPFDQLHFGHRDEFIRQKLHEMHITESKHFIDVEDFNSSNISDVLDFCILCTANGCISNDCKIAIDDHGFKFKIGWKSRDDVDFIIYKLDKSRVIKTTIDASSDFHKIPYSAFNGIDKGVVNGLKCIVNIYNSQYRDTLTTVPNFGVFDSEGLSINEIQEATTKMINNNHMAKVDITVYAIKYFHEVPNIYPAVNYYDIMESKLVYDEKYEKLRTPEGDLVVESTYSSSNELETCTPPITIDRETVYTFDTIAQCLNLKETLMKYSDTIKSIGKFISTGNEDMIYYMDELHPQLNKMLNDTMTQFKAYQKGAIITSLVPGECIRLFENLLANLRLLYNDFNAPEDASKFYDFAELYGNNYQITVDKICEPFMNEKLVQFKKAANISHEFFPHESASRFNRPISEQCFISLKYSEELESWIFAYPNIEHFHGIGNTFYINSGLTGKEIFKFFILYTDTMDPMNQYIEHFDLDTVIDFDKFYDEMDKYNGCIRYWDAEDRLAKISKILYRKYNDETCVHVLSKILKRKIDGESIIALYPSDINYEPSNVTSDNVEDYDEDSRRAPMTINFLFYTLSLLNDNEDKLQAYFYRKLAENKYNNRYTDINISSILDKDDKYGISFAQYSISPSRFPDDAVKPETAQSLMYYGLPLLTNAAGTSNIMDPYRFVLNVYDDTKFPLVTSTGLDSDYYVQYSDISEYSGSVISFKDTIEIGRLVSIYIGNVYDCISELQTNYQSPFNVTSICDRTITTLTAIKHDVQNIIETGNIMDVVLTNNKHIQDVLDVILVETIPNYLNNLKALCQDICSLQYNNINDVYAFMNDQLIYILKYVYKMFGFDDNVNDRVRALYKHLIQINSPMNAYVFKKWLNDIDLHILETLDQHVAANENNTYSDTLFASLYEALSEYITRVNPLLDDLDNAIKSDTDYADDLALLIEFCEKIINEVIFDLYTISSIDTDFSIIAYQTEPVYAAITLPNDDHVVAPFGPSIPGVHNLFFKVNTYVELDAYRVTSINSICEYIFFDDTDITNATISFLGADGTVLGTSTCDLHFTRSGSTADKGPVISQISNIGTTVIDFENHHESFEIVSDKVVNEKCADMNYELLMGNSFYILDHVSEYILNPNTWNPGSIDRIVIENEMINHFGIIDHGHKDCAKVFFKPCQVMHPAEPVNGKYFNGEKVYVKTSDDSYVFPITITTTSHSVEKGFVEAEVDQWNSTWMKIDDETKISYYLNNTIECEVLDDSIRNFLDEYSNDEYLSFYNPGYHTDEYITEDGCYVLPGDPIFVTSNAPFVYTRLNWMFNEDIPNRFIDEEHKQYKFIFIGEGFINDNDGIKINMINHDFNTKTLPERYPILKHEPDDHIVRRLEIKKFNEVLFDADQEYKSMNAIIDELQIEYDEEVSTYKKKKIMNKIMECKLKQNMLNDTIIRMKEYIFQEEPSTTWFNVRSNDAAMVYIDNGRAEKFSPIFISNIRDLCYTDDVDVFLYDWENKNWVDPSTYTVSYELVNGVKIDERDDYEVDNVMSSITIEPTNEFIPSRKLLVYFGYNKSDIFNDIEMNPNTIQVKFKPLLTLDKPDTHNDPYANINIRKHFDGYEKYTTTTDGSGEIYIKRIKRNGKYDYGNKFRLCDISIHDDNGDHDYSDIVKLKVKSSFKNTTSNRKFHELSYSSTVNVTIDSFKENEIVKLICVSNNESNSYDGNISTVMFEGVTSLNGSTQIITINKSSLSNYESGRFICTVMQDDRYESVGGLITVNVTSTSTSIYDEWVTIPTDYMLYHELPNEFKIIITNPIANANVTITLENKYIKDVDDTISEDNSGLYNPYEYYYSAAYKKRIPISDVRVNDNKKRLVIDTTLNPDINLIKSPYIGICRYSLSNIPENGLIDMTGYLPTPLSRDRYEFWVNGRCINNTDNLIIISPTSIQLRDLKSLHNFECIELVDDFYDGNDLMKTGPVYVDINGNTYSNYKLALLSNAKINKQNLAFIFNTNNHEKINDYSKSIIDNPNNKDLEVDILSTITFDDSDADYNKLTNIPSINGVPLFHIKLNSIGLTEIDNIDIIKAFDKIWKREAATDPFFINTHRCDSNLSNDNTGMVIHVKKITEPDWHDLGIDTTNMFVVNVTGPVDRYFTLYISTIEDGVIDNVNTTLKIIPFMTTNTQILLDSTYQNMWIHSTYPNTKPGHLN